MHFKNFAFMNIPKEDQLLCGEIVGVLDVMYNIVRTVSRKHPDVVLPGITCHSICRVLVKNIESLTLIDGQFNGLCIQDGKYAVSGCAHSWLKTPTGETILDPYPVDCGSSGTVIVVPVNIPEDWKSSAYYGACKYVECQPNPNYFNLDEINRDTLDLENFMKEWVKILDDSADSI